MARYRTWADWNGLTGDDALSDAERKLAKACKAGEDCTLGDGTRPDGPSKDRTIRAAFLRYLILGGCEDWRVDETGVRLQGAHIPDTLDLALAAAKGATILLDCRFDRPIVAVEAHFRGLALSGSALTALNAQGAQVTGGVFLRNVETEGAVSLSGATIGGQLSCVGARFRNAAGTALNAQGAQVTGHVFLNNVETEGEVSQLGATIGGQLACVGATFLNAAGLALNAQRMTVQAGMFWRNVTVHAGAVGLASAHVSDLADDGQSWPDDLTLDGFTYDRIYGPTDTAMRLAWLAKGDHSGGEFRPQPYTQLAKVLRDQGHERAARSVLIVREQQGFAEQRQRLRFTRDQARLWRRQSRDTTPKTIAGAEALLADPELHAEFRRNLEGFLAVHRGTAEEPPRRSDELRDLAIRDYRNRRREIELRANLRVTRSYLTQAFFYVAGYGFVPGRAILALGMVIALAATVAHLTWTEGSFAPNSDVILTSPEWRALIAASCLPAAAPPAPCDPNPAETWSASGPGLDWDSFNALGYATDLVIPLVDLGQTSAWAPSRDRGPWGYRLWWGRWVLEVLGWVVTALGAAAITGIIRRE